MHLPESDRDYDSNEYCQYGDLSTIDRLLRL